MSSDPEASSAPYLPWEVWHSDAMASRPQLEADERPGFNNRIFRMRKASPEIMGWEFGGGSIQLMKVKFDCIL